MGVRDQPLVTPPTSPRSPRALTFSLASASRCSRAGCVPMRAVEPTGAPQVTEMMSPIARAQCRPTDVSNEAGL